MKRSDHATNTPTNKTFSKPHHVCNANRIFSPGHQSYYYSENKHVPMPLIISNKISILIDKVGENMVWDAVKASFFPHARAHAAMASMLQLVSPVYRRDKWLQCLAHPIPSHPIHPIPQRWGFCTKWTTTKSVDIFRWFFLTFSSPVKANEIRHEAVVFVRCIPWHVQRTNLFACSSSFSPISDEFGIFAASSPVVAPPTRTSRDSSSSPSNSPLPRPGVEAHPSAGRSPFSGRHSRWCPWTVPSSFDSHPAPSAHPRPNPPHCTPTRPRPLHPHPVSSHCSVGGAGEPEPADWDSARTPILVLWRSFRGKWVFPSSESPLVATAVSSSVLVTTVEPRLLVDASDVADSKRGYAAVKLNGLLASFNSELTAVMEGLTAPVRSSLSEPRLSLDEDRGRGDTDWQGPANGRP